ncbi:DUF4270 family protein [Hymenobacter glacialis]|uniref:DUF4270 domain-containing protein n=1 Tax=Hymenobacter glacialis TaxID=1908236 RepID=A0A1G1SQU8_9BACT|nr:DUF4270 family protein [Hymenobacter glacialis]OGX80994.1 hypothetical protein BEN48_07465 [Hymenobacter glacialis]
MNWLLTSRYAPLVVLTALALTGCDEGTDLNVDLPGTASTSTEYIEYKTPLLDVATVRIAPVQTLKANQFLVGRLSDNIAGTTEARAYLNTITVSSKDSLPSSLTTPVLDSVVLVMGFDKVDGSLTTPAQFDVFNLQAPLDERQSYNSGSNTPTVSPALGQNITGRLNRTVQVTTAATGTTPATTATVPDQTVRLVLQRTSAVAAPFAPAPAVASSFFSTTFFPALRGTTFTQAQLDGLLKGLAITPSAGYSSGIVSFGRAYNHRLALFFHDGAVPAPPSTVRRKWRSFSVFFGSVYSGINGAPTSAPASDPRYYTQIINDLSGTPLNALADVTQAVSGNSGVLSGTSYLQDGVGLGTRVTFKSLDKLLATPGVIINRAELRVPVKPFSNALLTNPAAIYALEVDANNRPLQRIVNFIPTDRVVQADGSNQLATGVPSVGTLVNSSATQPYYNLLITSYLQAYIANKLDGNPAALVLVPNINSALTLSLNRAVIDANNISLRVYYTKR